MRAFCKAQIPIVIALGLISLAGCSDATVPAKAAAPESAPSPVVIAKPPVPEYYETSGPLVVENQIDVLAQREGIVAQVLVDTGATVQKGQVLARLDGRQLQAGYEAFQAKLRSMYANEQNFEAEVKVLQSDLDRAEAMYKEQLITDQQVEHARYKVAEQKFQTEREKQVIEENEAEFRSLKLEMEKAQIVAPFSGVVGRRYIRAGQRVSVNDRLFWITATAPIKVQFTLPENFVGYIRKGQELSVSSASAPQQIHLAHVTVVSPVVDPASGTIDVQAQVSGEPADLRPGMTATVRVRKPQ